MANLKGLMFKVGNALLTHNSNNLIALDAYHKQNAHAILLIALRQAIRGEATASYMWNVAAAAAWGPIDAVWKPASAKAKLAKELVDQLVRTAKDGGGQVARGDIDTTPGRVSHVHIRNRVKATWIMIHVPKDKAVYIFAVGEVERRGKLVKVAVLITCPLGADDQPKSVKVKRLPYKGDMVEDKIAEQDDDDGYCFLTTACLRALAPAEAGAELALMRLFRDGYVAQRPDGAEAIATYYAVAPDVVRAIEARADAEALYQGLYRDMIRPTLDHIRAGESARAFDCYRTHVESLARRFAPDRP